MWQTVLSTIFAMRYRYHRGKVCLWIPRLAGLALVGGKRNFLDDA